jgi:hypothetical protein
MLTISDIFINPFESVIHGEKYPKTGCLLHPQSGCDPWTLGKNKYDQNDN